MDTLSAFLMGEANRGKPLMVFDWDKAAALIVERGAVHASAGLEDDWEWTGGAIFTDGQPILVNENGVYLASTWARPLLDLDGESLECWCYQGDDCSWTADTYWPDSARRILGGSS